MSVEVGQRNGASGSALDPPGTRRRIRRGKSILSKSCRIFFVDGPGQVVDSYRSWSAGEDFVSETQLTFSGQMFDFCRAHGLLVYAVSWNPARALVRDGAFIVENRPKPLRNPHGVFYHVSQVWYGLSLIVSALRFGADVAVVVSGTTHWFVLSLLTLARVKVIPCLHNSFWPSGYPQTREGFQGHPRARRVVLAALCRGHALRFARVPAAGRDDHRRAQRSDLPVPLAVLSRRLPLRRAPPAAR